MVKTVIEMLLELVDEPGGAFADDPETCRRGFQFLLMNVECALGDETDRLAAEGGEVYYPGWALFEYFPVLTGPKGKAIRAAIEKMAERPDLPKPENRDFLNVMLGYLLCGQEEARRRLNPPIVPYT